MADRAYLERMVREFTDKGMLIESGWMGLRLLALHPNTPKEQLEEMRMAFFAGAQHLLGCLTGSESVLEDTGNWQDVTEGDMERMTKIHDELMRFIEEFKLRHAKTKGSV